MARKYETADADAAVRALRREHAIDVEWKASIAEIDAAAARALRDEVPDLAGMVEGQIAASEASAAKARDIADRMRQRAGMADRDYPDMTAKLDGRIAGLETNLIRWEEMADDPEAYATHETVADHTADPTTFLRFQVANTATILAATVARRDAEKAKARAGKRAPAAE